MGGKRKALTATRGRRTRLDLLIIECDTATLASQGLSLAKEVELVAKLAGGDVVSVAANTRADLLGQLSTIAKLYTFRALVVIGHGNQGGVRLASDDPSVTPWTELAELLKPFRPERLALVSCKAGRTLGAGALFAGLGRLDEIYASPLNLDVVQARVVHALTPFLLDDTLSEAMIRAVQVGHFVLTEGTILLYTRQAWEDGDDTSDLVAALVEEHVAPVAVEAARNALRRLKRWLDE